MEAAVERWLAEAREDPEGGGASRMGRDAGAGVVDELALRLFELEKAEWGRKAFGVRYFLRRVADPDAAVVVLRGDGEVRGFLIAVPDETVEGGLYVEDTLIEAPYRGRRLIALLGEALDAEAARRGFRYLTRDASIANGYADAIERAYRGRVIERREHKSPYGPQRYLKIDLHARAIPFPR